MKTAILILEGAIDVPFKMLRGSTPLQVARCAHADALAADGLTGVISNNTPLHAERLLAHCMGLPACAADSIAPAPFLALGNQLDLDKNDFVLIGSLVHATEHEIIETDVAMGVEEAEAIKDALYGSQETFGGKLHCLRDSRYAMVFSHMAVSCNPGRHPALVSSENWPRYFQKTGKLRLQENFWKWSRERLVRHPVNQVRLDLNEPLANGLWLWGGGRLCDVPLGEGSISTGATFSTSLLARGLSQYLDWKSLPTEINSTTLFDVPQILDALREQEYVLVFVEALPEFGKVAKPSEKIRTLERLDREVIGPLWTLLEACRPSRLLLIASNAFSVGTEYGLHEDMPFVLVGEDVDADAVECFDEISCAHGKAGRISLKELFKKYQVL